jgi:hypothetical protein
MVSAVHSSKGSNKFALTKPQLDLAKLRHVRKAVWRRKITEIKKASASSSHAHEFDLSRASSTSNDKDKESSSDNLDEEEDLASKEAKRSALSNHITELEKKLDDLNEQKHKLFLLLKMVLAEDEKKKQAEMAEKKLLEQKMSDEGQKILAVSDYHKLQNGSLPISRAVTGHPSSPSPSPSPSLSSSTPNIPQPSTPKSPHLQSPRIKVEKPGLTPPTSTSSHHHNPLSMSVPLPHSGSMLYSHLSHKQESPAHTYAHAQGTGEFGIQPNTPSHSHPTNPHPHLPLPPPILQHPMVPQLSPSISFRQGILGPPPTVLGRATHSYITPTINPNLHPAALSHVHSHQRHNYNNPSHTSRMGRGRMFM